MKLSRPANALEPAAAAVYGPPMLVTVLVVFQLLAATEDGGEPVRRAIKPKSAIVDETPSLPPPTAPAPTPAPAAPAARPAPAAQAAAPSAADNSAPPAPSPAPSAAAKPAAKPAGNPAIPPAAKDRYEQAVSKLNAHEYGPANDLLNALAGEYPRVAEIFSSRCSAQLGLQRYTTAEADCLYALQLKALPVALYALAVAEDGQAKYAQAISHYRQYAGSAEATPALRAQATARADVLAPYAAGPAVVNPSQVNTAAPGTTRGTFMPSTPPAGSVILYVYRNLLPGVGSAVTVWVDNQVVSDLPNDRYLEITMAAGQHTVLIKTAVDNLNRVAPSSSMLIDLRPGQVGYLKLLYAPQNDDVGFALAANPATGAREIRDDCRLQAAKRL